jgi:L-aminopeptidase/D-esterase-like protein
MTHDGFARALWPSHTPYDGDLVFALATGRRPRAEPVDLVALGAAGAACMARAIARGVYEATPAPGDRVPTWRERFGS